MVTCISFKEIFTIKKKRKRREIFFLEVNKVKVNRKLKLSNNNFLEKIKVK